MIDLPPIPLVEVDEPMVLEGRDYIPPPKAPAPPPQAARPAPPPAPAFTEIEPEALFEPTLIEPPPIAPPAPRPAPPPSPPAPAPAPLAEIETPTMAEIYATQGHFDQALAVYRKIIERQPHETQYRERVEELLMLSRASRQAPPMPSPSSTPSAKRAQDSYEAEERTIRVLEDWLDAIRKSREA